MILSRLASVIARPFVGAPDPTELNVDLTLHRIPPKVDDPTVKPMPEGLPESAYDGCFIGADGIYPADTNPKAIAGIGPSNGKPIGQTLYWINGIGETVGESRSHAQALADATQHEVVLIHKSTAGFLKDAAGTIVDRMHEGRFLGPVLDRFHLGSNAAVNTMAKQVIEPAVKAGEQENVGGHSRGALDCSLAAEEAIHDYLMNPSGMGLSEKTDAQEVINKTLRGLSLGGASRTYPDYIHWTIGVNEYDPVQLFSGFTLPRPPNFFIHPGAESEVFRFAHGNTFTGEAHGLPQSYLPAYVKYVAEHGDPLL
jgi:hypothetical protein